MRALQCWLKKKCCHVFHISTCIKHRSNSLHPSPLPPSSKSFHPSHPPPFKTFHTPSHPVSNSLKTIQTTFHTPSKPFQLSFQNRSTPCKYLHLSTQPLQETFSHLQHLPSKPDPKPPAQQPSTPLFKTLFDHSPPPPSPSPSTPSKNPVTNTSKFFHNHFKTHSNPPSKILL